MYSGVGVHRLTYRQRIATGILLVVAFAFVTLDLSGGGLRGAHSGVRGVLGALYRGVDGVVGPARRFVQGIPDVASNRSTIASLQAQNAKLQQELTAAQAAASADAQLTRLQLAAAQGGYRVVASQVIGFGPSGGFDWTITIGVPSGSGIAAGQTVTSGAGLLGRVLHVDGGTAVVLLAADPGSGVGVRDSRDGQLGVVTGAGGNGFSLTPLDPSADVRVGDTLSTGPVGQTSYVAGIPVGRVTAVHVASDGTTTATVRPMSSPTAVDVVGVIVSVAR